MIAENPNGNVNRHTLRARRQPRLVRLMGAPGYSGPTKIVNPLSCANEGCERFHL